MSDRKGREKRRFADGRENYSTVGDRYGTGVPVFKLWKPLNPLDTSTEKYVGKSAMESTDADRPRPAKKKAKRGK